MEPSLQRLPPELLHNICAFLDQTHPSDLVGFARASRACYSIASPLLHRTVKLSHEPAMRGRFSMCERLMLMITMQSHYMRVRIGLVSGAGYVLWSMTGRVIRWNWEYKVPPALHMRRRSCAGPSSLQ